MPRATDRLLRLLSLLQSGRFWSASALAERLDVSTRTIRRDIDRLRDLDYTIDATMGPDGGYRLAAGESLPPLLFDDEQVIALTVALRTAALAGAGTEDASLRALTTIRQVTPSRLRPRLDALTFSPLAPAVDRSSGPAATDVLIALSTATRASEVVRFDYVPVGAEPGDEPTRHRVEPYGLVATGGRWYLVAWDLERDDWRIFRADRLTPRVPTGPRFRARNLPGGDAATFVAARFKGSPNEDRWPCRGTVMLRLPARHVVPFAGDGVVVPIDEHSCHLTAGSWSWMSLAALFGRFDADLTVIEPERLREAFARLAQRASRAATSED